MNIKKILIGAGHEIDEAENGEQCLEKMTSSQFDLISLDLLMPIKSGIDVLRELQGRDHPPTIVLSADIQATVRDEIESLGVEHFLNKPINKDEFLLKVEALVGNA